MATGSKHCKDMFFQENAQIFSRKKSIGIDMQSGFVRHWYFLLLPKTVTVTLTMPSLR